MEETYYASLTKRLHALIESGYLKEAKSKQEGSKGQANYELKMKAHLARFLKKNSIQNMPNQATDAQAAHILLALLNVILSERDKDNH